MDKLSPNIERYWSGGIDRNQTENVEVFVDGSTISIGVQSGSHKTAILEITAQETEKIIHMLQSALNHANEWKGETP